MSNCLLCQKPSQTNLSIHYIFSKQKMAEHQLCLSCKSLFERLDPEKSCPGCGREQSNKEVCNDCLKWQVKYPRLDLNHQALFKYNQAAREFMDQYKFQGDVVLAEAFKEEIAIALHTYQKSDLIVSIPISALSQQKRGYNQVEQFLKQAGVPTQNILRNKNQTALQSSKNRADRLKMEQPFEWVENFDVSSLSQQSILIVDDVYTTGRTILHARNFLEENMGSELKTASFSLFR